MQRHIDPTMVSAAGSIHVPQNNQSPVQPAIDNKSQPVVEQFSTDFYPVQFPTNDDGTTTRWYNFHEVKTVAATIQTNQIIEKFKMKEKDFDMERWYDEGLASLASIYPGLAPSNEADTNGTPKIYSGRTAAEFTANTEKYVGETEQLM